MKQTILILFFLAPLRLFAPDDSRVPLMKESGLNPFISLWEATCKIESSNNPLAVNEKEQAYGIAQIRQVRIDDYNKRTGSYYSLYDCLDSALAYKVYMYYASKYGPLDIETIAKAWNGSGIMTDDYWKKILEEL